MDCDQHSDVLLIGCVPPPIGGVSQHVWRLARKLSESGIKIRVLDTHPGPAKYDASGAQLRISPQRTLFKSAWLIRQLRSQPEAVAHFHFSILRSPRSLAWLLDASPRKQRKILTLHHGDLQAHYAQLTQASKNYYRNALSKFDLVLSLSPKQYHFYREVIGLADECIQTSSSLLHLSQSFIQSITRDSLDDPWEAMQLDSPCRIVASGYPYPDYWHAETIAMVDRLQADRSASLAVCLYGPETPHLQELKRMAAARPHVKILWGLDFMPFMRLLATSSLYVRPAVKDSYGLAVADAASTGTPVVASDVCPRDPRAVLFPTGCEEAYLSHVRSLLGAKRRIASPTLHLGLNDDAFGSILQSYELPYHHTSLPAKAA